MTTLTYRNHDSGPKTIARRISMTGHYLPVNTSRSPATHVVNLPGYDHDTNTCNLDVVQGIAEGVIAKDATIWGVEYEGALIRPIRHAAKASGVDLRLSYCGLQDFRPPHKLDMFLGDLMCLPHEWIGEYLAKQVVPMMKDTHSSISVNMSVQNAFGTGIRDAMTLYRQAYEQNPMDYLGPRGWDLARPQDSCWAAMDVLATQHIDVPLARSIARDDGLLCTKGQHRGQEACFLSFVGVHRWMKDTSFQYKGCYLYRQIPTSTLMFTLYYDRG